MRVCDVSTILLIEAYGIKRIKHPPLEPWVVSAAWDALHGRPMSKKREARLRDALGVEPLPVVVEVPACPSCAARGIVRSHGDKLDCHGQPVAAVAVLAPGQTVTTQRPPRQYSRIADMPVSMLARAIKERRSYDHYD